MNEKEATFVNETNREQEDTGEPSEVIDNSINPVIEENEQEAGEQPAPVCRKCGAMLAEGLLYCPKCGTPVKRICAKCQTELAPDQDYCPKCGSKYSDGLKAIDFKNSTNRARSVLKVNAKRIVALAVAIVVLVAGLAVIKNALRPNFGKMVSEVVAKNPDYEEILVGNGIDGEGCAVKIGDDGKWMKVDSSPSDEDSDDRNSDTILAYIYATNDLIKHVNTKLGFSDIVLDDMNATTSAMGVQTAESDKATVKWTYHPDKGLEVTYTLKK